MVRRRVQKIILEGTATDVRVRCIKALCEMAGVFDGAEVQNELLNTYKQVGVAGVPDA